MGMPTAMPTLGESSKKRPMFLKAVAEGITEPKAMSRAEAEYERSLFFIKQYRKICRLDGLAQKFFESNQKIRLLRRKYFEKMRDKCISDIAGWSAKSTIGKAMRYFLKNYHNFVRFIVNPND